MFETLAATLLAGFSLLDNHEKHKYTDKIIELKRLRYEEQNKPDDKRSDAVLDNIDFELRAVGLAFYALARQQDLKNF